MFSTLLRVTAGSYESAESAKTRRVDPGEPEKRVRVHMLRQTYKEKVAPTFQDEIFTRPVFPKWAPVPTIRTASVYLICSLARLELPLRQLAGTPAGRYRELALLGLTPLVTAARPVILRSRFRFEVISEQPPCRRAGEIVQIRRSSTDVDRRPIGTVVTGGYPTGSRKELIEGGRVVESSVPGKCAGDGYMLYFPAWITCPAICRRSVMVFAVSCLESRRRIVSCVRIMSPSATAAITLRAESSMVDIALSA